MKKTSLILMLLLAIFALPAKASFSPSAYAPAVLAEDDDDDGEYKPVKEPAFTVYLDIDDAEAVYLTVNDKPVAHTAGINTVTVDPGDGYIKVHVNDGYFFSNFTDIDNGNDYLQYTNQVMPVTVRKAISQGTEELVIVDGHTFKIETGNMSQFEQFTLTVNVDNASKAELRLGSSIDMLSSANRIVKLVDGENTISYTSADKYLHVSGSSWFDPLQSVTLDGKKVQGDGQMNAVYTVQLNGAKTQGKLIDVVTAPVKEEDQFAFTAVIDDTDGIKYFTRMPANKDLQLVAGKNTFTFNAGDYFEVWVYAPALEATYNDEPITYDESMRRYHFYPTPDGTLKLSFNETTGIDAIENEADTPAAIYTIDGKLAPTTNPRDLNPGIYIIANKKIRIK